MGRKRVGIIENGKIFGKLSGVVTGIIKRIEWLFGLFAKPFQFLWKNITKNNAERVIAYFSVLNVVVLVITFGVLFFNLRSVSQQVALTQTLGQPFCAIKQVFIAPTKHPTEKDPKEFKVSIVVKNFGNYMADDVSMNYKLYGIEVKDRKIKRKELLHEIKELWPEKIIMLPQHEFEHLVAYVPKGYLEKWAVGYERELHLEFAIQYRNGMRSRMDRFKFTYAIRKLSGEKNRYDTVIEYSGSDLNQGKSDTRS